MARLIFRATDGAPLGGRRHRATRRHRCNRTGLHGQGVLHRETCLLELSDKLVRPGM